MDWLIFLIVIGVISSLVNKKRETTKTDTKYYRTRETPEIPGYNFPEFEPDFSQEMDKTETIIETTNNDEIYLKQKEEKRILTLDKKHTDLDKKNTEPNKLKTDEYNFSFKELNKDKIIEGFIIGEVFGAPRSKKPHNTSLIKPKNIT